MLSGADECPDLLLRAMSGSAETGSHRGVLGGGCFVSQAITATGFYPSGVRFLHYNGLDFQTGLPSQISTVRSPALSANIHAIRGSLTKANSRVTTRIASGKL